MWEDGYRNIVNVDVRHLHRQRHPSVLTTPLFAVFGSRHRADASASCRIAPGYGMYVLVAGLQYV